MKTIDVPGGGKSFDKNIYVWVFTFLLGGFGIDRFMRGQKLFGVLKLLFCWTGLWALVDWIIALTKAYGPYKDDECIVFDKEGKYTK